MADKDKYSFIVVKYPGKEHRRCRVAGRAWAYRKRKWSSCAMPSPSPKQRQASCEVHQTKDDTAKKGFLKGGGIGVLFALLFGPVGWIAAGAALGTAFAMFDRGIKDKLLKELGENMTPEQSAMAVLVEEADWEKRSVGWLT